MDDYAVSYLEDHARAILSTLATYERDGDETSAAYWRPRFASVVAAVKALKS